MTTVGTAKRILRAYATRRQDADERWKGDLVKRLQGTPARPDPNPVQQMIPIRFRFDPPQVGEPDPTMLHRKEPQMRRMKITESMLQQYGYTEGCELPGQSCWHDSEARGEACRQRMEQALDGDGAGRELCRKNRSVRTR